MFQTIYNKRDRGTERALVTSVRIDANPRHWWLGVWNRGGKAGDLCVNAADGQAVVDLLIPPADQSHSPHPDSPAHIHDPIKEALQ